MRIIMRPRRVCCHKEVNRCDEKKVKPRSLKIEQVHRAEQDAEKNEMIMCIEDIVQDMEIWSGF